MTKAEFLDELQTDIPDDVEVRCAGIMSRKGDDGHILTRMDCKGIENTFLIGRMIRNAAEEAGVPPIMIVLAAAKMAEEDIEKTTIDLDMIERTMKREATDDADQ